MEERVVQCRPPEGYARVILSLSFYLSWLLTFSQLIQKKVTTRALHGVKPSHNGPEISHHLFANDSLLFTRATRQECLTIVDILNQYEADPSRKLNMKSQRYPSVKRFTVRKKEELIDILHMRHVDRHQKYLGIPTICGRSKKVMFLEILDRMWKKLRGWKEKLLSRAGKEILIKAVIQALPTYLMGVYKIPADVIQEIHSAMARFWWEGRGEERNMHLLSWENMCKPKCMGGMGFKDLAVFNDALLGKQVWRLLHYKHSLVNRVMSMKYYPHDDILSARLGFSNSYGWHNIWGPRAW
ncbi:uncharacterized protein LOC125493568 [Beta vulgaris subsp. vulgaris]|uniref:uncharacterized protein LOC125493568 n=1 Tax=Beta vulgaris subsp. vulgaris TaxID=3555 RepID=UPI002036AFC4|nr:uncharacterized protein LOC125493568 [Beta vulgaris subsp. vulgaris]